MPPLPDVPQVIKVTYEWSVGTDLTAMNRLFFRNTGTDPDNAGAQALATHIYTDAVTNLIPLLANANQLESVSVQSLATTSSGFGQHVAATAGTRGSGLLPAAAAVLLNIRLHRRYRGGKPRVYWPFGIPSDLSTAQNWTSGAVAAFLAGIATHIDDILLMTDGGVILPTLVNVSYFQGVNPPTTLPSGRVKQTAKLRVGGPQVDFFNGVAINPRVASQRRRNLHSV